LGTREIEESISSHPNIAEVAVVGVADPLKGQVAMAFAILKDTQSIATPEQRASQEAAVMKVVDAQLGAVARPARVHFVTALPKTRSGKLLRRSIQALCEGRDPGDLTTIEDPSALEQIRRAVGV
ncbi:MAG: propionyl-CoA synthetase, partial [Burkholderiaceae bacterium]